MNLRGLNRWGVAGRGLVLAGLVATLVLAVGCHGETKKMARSPLDPLGEVEPGIALAPGDDLDIQFLYTPNLNVVQSIRRDGMISMPLVGEVKAEGLSPVQLTQKLKELYAREVLDPEITVILRSQWGRRAYVGGQVRRPRAIPLLAQTSVVEAIMSAGGPREDYAELRNVLILRQDGERRKIGSINLAASFGLEEPEDGETTAVFYLRPGDIVYVPETEIVEINRWLDQHVHDPFLGAGVRASLGPVDLLYDLSGSRGTESWGQSDHY